MKKMTLLLVCIMLLSSTALGTALAADFVNDPFDGGWQPTGTTALIMYGTQSSASKMYTDGSQTARGIDYESQIGIARIAGWRELGPITYQFSALVPFGRAALDMGGGSTSASGIGDPQFNLAVQAMKWEGGYMTADIAVIPPLGEYDHKQALNIGSNRWLFRPTLNVGQNVGRFHFDFIASGEFYTDNEDYGTNKDTLSKDPDFYVEIHASYILLPESGTYISLSGIGKWGGEEEVNKTKMNEYDDYAIKFGLGTNITDTVNLFMSLKADLKTENGPKGHAATVRLAKFF